MDVDMFSRDFKRPPLEAWRTFWTMEFIGDGVLL
jgi:hypothetical protein